MKLFDLISVSFKVAVFDLKARYNNSVLGFFWTFVSPLTVLIVLSIVFGNIIKVNIKNFPVFVLTAYIPWSFYSACFHNSAYCFKIRKPYIKNFNLNPAILPVSVVFSGLIHFVLSIPIIFISLTIFKIEFTYNLFWLPLIILFQMIFLVGISFFVSSLSFFFKDIEEFINIFLLVHFYMTPIFYSINLIDDKYKDIYFLNPMACFTQLYRFSFLNNSKISFQIIIYIILSSFFFLFTGYYFLKDNFRKGIEKI